MAATTWFTLATPILSDRCSPCLRCNSHLKKTEENLLLNEEKKGYVFALHLTLGQAKAMGTKLIVGVHTDAEIAKHKVGKLSPLFHNSTSSPS